MQGGLPRRLDDLPASQVMPLRGLHAIVPQKIAGRLVSVLVRGVVGSFFP